MMNKKWKRHSLYWLFYAVYYVVINWWQNVAMSFWLVLLTVPYFAFVFYSVYYLLERYFRRGRYLLGTLFLLLFYTVSGTLVYVVLHGGLDPYGVYERYLLTGSFQWSGFLNSMREVHLLFTIGAVLYYLHVGKLRAVEEKLAEAERRLLVEEERRQYEYSALASQVSPHLLANIFHSWSHKLRAKMPEMAQQVAETYQLMIFYIKAQEPDGPMTVLLQDEITAVERFIEIQRETRTQPVYINITKKGNFYGYAIPPTSLLSLVKNAFKHGDLQDQQFPLEICVEVTNNQLSVTVENQKRGEAALASHGYGLRNLRRRLEIVYADRAQLEIEETETAFKVTININF